MASYSLLMPSIEPPRRSRFGMDGLCTLAATRDWGPFVGAATAAGTVEVWAKPLADGGSAVALFNRGDAAAKVTDKWSDVGVKGSHKVCDLWMHADLGKVADQYTAEVPSHGDRKSTRLNSSHLGISY